MSNIDLDRQIARLTRQGNELREEFIIKMLILAVGLALQALAFWVLLG